MGEHTTPTASGGTGPSSGGTAPAPADPGSPAELSAPVVGTAKPTQEELAKKIPAPQPAPADGGAKNPPPTDPAPATPPVPPVVPPVVEPARGAKPPETPPTTPTPSAPKEPPKDPPTPDKGKDEPPVRPKGPEVVKTEGGCEHMTEIRSDGSVVMKSRCVCGGCKPVQQVGVHPGSREVVTPPSPAVAPPTSDRRRLPWWAWLVIAGIAIPAIAWVMSRLLDQAASKETGKLPAPVMIDEQAREAAKKANERATAVEEQVKNLSVPHDSVDQKARDEAKAANAAAAQLENRREALTGRVEKVEMKTEDLGNKVVATQEQLTAATGLLKGSGGQDGEMARRIADLERRMPRQGAEPKNGPAPLVSPPAPKPPEPVKTGPETWTAEERRIARGMISCLRRGLGANLAKDAKSYEFDAAIMQGWESLWDTTSKKPRPTEAELNSAFPIGK